MSDYEDDRPENPWTKVLAVLGVVLLVLGLGLLLIPGETVDVVRALAGVATLTTAGTLLACWLVLAGFGWYLRRR